MQQNDVWKGWGEFFAELIMRWMRSLREAGDSFGRRLRWKFDRKRMFEEQRRLEDEQIRDVERGYEEADRLARIKEQQSSELRLSDLTMREQLDDAAKTFKHRHQLDGWIAATNRHLESFGHEGNITLETLRTCESEKMRRIADDIWQEEEQQKRDAERAKQQHDNEKWTQEVVKHGQK